VLHFGSLDGRQPGTHESNPEGDPEVNIADEIRRITGMYQAQLQALFAPVKVLDKGFVELRDIMGDDDEPVDAARVSFDKDSTLYTVEQNDRLTRYLLDHNHGTPFEMVDFKFRICAPVLVWWHWVRHRIASYNFVSGRYVPFAEDQFYEIAADQWRLQSKTNKQGSEGLLDPATGVILSNALKAHIKESFRLYEYALSEGVAREQARVFLPFAAAYYTAIVKMNGRSLMNFLALRSDGHAQSEIRDYADAIRSIVSKTHPRIFA
jgi:thymidylate synthase (FAD)